MWTVRMMFRSILEIDVAPHPVASAGSSRHIARNSSGAFFNHVSIEIIV
jgi:hypothetical protein